MRIDYPLFMLAPLLTFDHVSLFKHQQGPINTSLDLGKSTTQVTIAMNMIHFPDNQILPITDLDNIKENTIYFVQDNELRQVALFSDETNLHYKLRPTKDWPMLTLSSTPMHLHKNVTPKESAQLMIREIMPIKGNVLDCCCGLGYTAIIASKEADKVYTFDDDPNVQLVATYNPYSQELFTNKKIELKQVDIFEAIKTFKPGFFQRILHDPPTFKYAPHLYSKEFHQELYRVLSKNGILYHYCPQPQKTKGMQLHPRLLRQLKDAGFQNVEYHQKSQGIRAIKR